MKYFIAITFVSTFLMISSVNAQRPCGSDEYFEYLKNQDPGYELRYQQQLESILENAKNNPNPKPQSIITIPVVFHVVYQNSSQNLPDACLQDQIASLNRDFRKMNSDITKAPSQFQAIAADIEFEFCLASKDPQGNPTNGITRKQTSVSNFGVSDKIKFSSSGGTPIWDKDNYLNIWIGEIGNVGGFSPKGCSSASTDGVVIHWAEVGNCDKISNGDQGRTTVHEVGHWMGLSHTFQGGCSGMSSSNCASAGDYVCDTPPVAQQSFSMNCGLQTNSCSESPNQIDMIWNHMDYTHPACKVLFTAGQKALMYASTSSCRSAIYNGMAAASSCGLSTGISNNNIEDQIEIFPNPSNGLFNFRHKGPVNAEFKLKVIDLMGSVVYEAITRANTEPHTLDLTSYQPGIYFAEFYGQGVISRKKVIIAR